MAKLPSWATKLQQYNATQPSVERDDDGLDYEERLEVETAELLKSPPKAKAPRRLSEIPTFFTTKSGSQNKEKDRESEEQSSNNELFSEIARELFFDHHESRLLSEGDLDQLFNNMVSLLKEFPNHSQIALQNNNCFLSYEVFRELKQTLPPRAHKFFSPSVFRKFAMNQNGQIRGISFHQFVSLSLNLLHQFLTLCRYDLRSNLLMGQSHAAHTLSESDLEIFIGDQIEMIPSLLKVDEAFHPYYIYHAVRKFIFCLNPESAKKQIPITTILCSDAFREFNEFRFCSQNMPLNDEEPIKMSKNNWFSCSNALRVYKMYLELDCDHNGTLSQKEMLQFNQSSLSNLCVQRIFQYKKTWDQEMDYKGFLDFVLAIEHKQLLPSLAYFWEILDLDEQGYLSPLTLHTLFRSVQKKMGIFGLEPINIDDVMTEITDMVHPKDPEKITKQDLVNSKMWSTVIDILTDVKGFWEYDNRESINSPQNQQ